MIVIHIMLRMLICECFALESYGNGWGNALQCPSNAVQVGLLCYGCTGSYTRLSGGTCYQNCPSGWSYTSTTCIQPTQTRTLKTPGTGNACTTGYTYNSPEN